MTKAHKQESLKPLTITFKLIHLHLLHPQLKQNLSKVIKQLRPIHNKVLQAIQTNIELNGNLTLDSSDSSSSTDVYDENVSINDSSSNRKRKSTNSQHSIKRSQSKQRKQVTFAQVHQNPSEVSDKTSSEISPILETYEEQLQTFQSSNTFETLDTTPAPSFVQHTAYHNESQPMTTHQRAALAQAALVNFFGEAGTVTSILNRVQPSHTQTISEVSDEQDLDISQQGRSFPVSTQTYTIPCISQSTQPTNTYIYTTKYQETKLQSTTLLYRSIFFF